jgi:hypothetical protein
VTTYLLSPDNGEAAEWLRARGAEVLGEGGPADWVARTSAQLHARTLTRGAPGPYVVIARGTAANDVPALAFALRAARRPAHGYVLVEPVLAVDRHWVDWPDAPVVVITSSDDVARSARLRGWRVARGSWAECAADVIDSQ